MRARPVALGTGRLRVGVRLDDVDLGSASARTQRDAQSVSTRGHPQGARTRRRPPVGAVTVSVGFSVRQARARMSSQPQAQTRLRLTMRIPKMASLIFSGRGR